MANLTSPYFHDRETVIAKKGTYPCYTPYPMITGKCTIDACTARCVKKFNIEATGRCIRGDKGKVDCECIHRCPP
ncbi:hypothetical protein Bca101_041673 [Brassica carinata]